MTKANEALNKMADNARELGLDYEQPAPVAKPHEQEPSDLDVWKARALQAEAVIEKFMAKQPAQQEPVGDITCWTVKGNLKNTDFDYYGNLPDGTHLLYTSLPTLSLAQRQARSADTWVWLTDEEIYSVVENLQVMHHRPPTTDSRIVFARAIEAKLKEKNNV